MTDRISAVIASRRRWLACGWALLTGVSTTALAQDYPSKTITLVVPYPAGGPTDNTARLLGLNLARLLRGNVIVENKPGAATNIAAAYVARAPKDGYTLLLAPGTMTSVNPYLYRKLTFSVDDFAPISLVSKQAFVLMATQSLPVNSLPELVTFAKTRPNGLTVGNAGVGGVNHVVSEWIARTLGIKTTDISYKGSSQSTVDLISGQIDLLVGGISAAAPLQRAGKVRIVASLGEERANLPAKVQTFQEAGYPALVAYATFGLMAPAGTPEDVVRRLHAAVVETVKSPDFSDKLLSGGELAVSSESPQAYLAHIRAENARWGPIVKPLNVQLD